MQFSNSKGVTGTNRVLSQYALGEAGFEPYLVLLGNCNRVHAAAKTQTVQVNSRRP
jgi:hypothetical protein